MAQIAIGFAISAAVSAAEVGIAYLLRKKPVSAPPIQDLQVSSAAYGAMIPIPYASARYAGELIWTPGIYYTTYKISSGGPSQIGYAYFASMAWAFGEGPTTIARIWADTRLIYKGGQNFGIYSIWNSITTYQADDIVAYPANPQVDSSGNVIDGRLYQCIVPNSGVVPQGASLYWTDVTSEYPPFDYNVTYVPGNVVSWSFTLFALIGNKSSQGHAPGPPNDQWQYLQAYYGSPTIYPGDEAQLPDPTIQANEGAAQTSAFRGLCYAVWEGFPLANFGNRIPNIRVETAGAPAPKVVQSVFAENGAGVAQTTLLEATSLISEVQGDNGTGDYASVTPTGGTLFLGKQGFASVGPSAKVGVFALPGGISASSVTEVTVVGSAHHFWGDANAVAQITIKVNGTAEAFPLNTPNGGVFPWSNLLSPTPDYPNPATFPFSTVELDVDLAASVQGQYNDELDFSWALEVEYLGTPSTISVTLPGPVEAGDYLFVFVRYANLSGGVPQILSDTVDGVPVGNTWTALYTANGFAIFYCTAKAAAAGETIVAGPTTGSDCSYADMWAGEITNAASFLSAFASGTNPTGSDVPSATVGGETFAPTIASLPTNSPWQTAIVKFAPAITNGLLVGPLYIGFYNDDTSSSPVAPSSITSFSVTPVPWGVLMGTTYSLVAQFTPQSPGAGGTLAAFVLDICERSGIDSSLIDVSGIAPSSLAPVQTFRGTVVKEPTTAQEVLRKILPAYFVDACESDGTLRFLPRAQTVSTTIPESDLGLEKDKCKLIEGIDQELDHPQRVMVIYDDVTLNYQTGKQEATRTLRVLSTRNEDILNYSLSLIPDEAKQIAEVTLFMKWLERHPYSMNLWRASYMLIDPTDWISFTYEGISFQVRVTDETLGQGFVTAINSVTEDERIFTSSAVGGTSVGFSGGTVPASQVAILFLFDVPLLKDSDSNPGGTGYYFGVGSQDPNFVSATLYDSPDNVSFSVVESDPFAVSFGYATTALPAPGRSPWIWDDNDTVTLKMGAGTPASDTDLNVLSGSNVVILGSEIIQFGTAAQNTDDTVTLSHLLRGRRGTEWAVSTHVVGELAVFAATGVQRVDKALAIVGQTRYYEALTGGQVPIGSASESFVDTAQDLMPYAPVHMAGSRDISGNLTITWVRRTRIGWLNLAQDPVPVSEDSELYDVDIYNGSSVVRTLSNLTSPTASYSAAQQTTDFGSAQSSIAIKVYQKSGEVGRGFAGSANV